MDARTVRCMDARAPSGGRPRRCRLRRRRPRIHQDRRRRQQEGEAGDVVEPLPGLKLHEHLGAQRDAAADHRLRAHSVRPPDAVAGEQRNGQPAVVDDQRDGIAVQEEDAEGVEDLGVRRIERREEDGIEEEDASRVARLSEAGRERHVVPEGVGPVHSGRDAAECRDHPGGHEGRQHRQREDLRERGARRRGRPIRRADRTGGAHGVGRKPRPDTDDQGGGEHEPVLEAAEGPDHLRRPQEGGRAEHDLDEARGCANPAGEEEPANACRAEGDRAHGDRELDAAAQEGAGAQGAVGSQDAHRTGGSATCR